MRLGRRAQPGSGLLPIVAAGTSAACGAGMLIAAALGAADGGGAVADLAVAGAVAFAAGLAGLRLLPRPRRAATISPAVGLGAITLAWVLAAALGSIPLISSGVLPNPIDAYFEAMSGFSTTGATLIDDVDATPASLLAWRSLMQWLGGVGIVVLIVAIAPALAPGLQRFF